jgi:hypothetical protein
LILLTQLAATTASKTTEDPDHPMVGRTLEERHRDVTVFEQERPSVVDDQV